MNSTYLALIIAVHNVYCCDAKKVPSSVPVYHKRIEIIIKILSID
jgi:hypothetical protein